MKWGEGGREGGGGRFERWKGRRSVGTHEGKEARTHDAGYEVGRQAGRQGEAR